MSPKHTQNSNHNHNLVEWAIAVHGMYESPQV